MASSLEAATIDLVAIELDSTPNFYDVDESTGIATVIGPTASFAGLDYRSDGVLYGSSTVLYTVDPVSYTHLTLPTTPYV